MKKIYYWNKYNNGIINTKNNTFCLFSWRSCKNLNSGCSRLYSSPSAYQGLPPFLANRSCFCALSSQPPPILPSASPAYQLPLGPGISLCKRPFSPTLCHYPLNFIYFFTLHAHKLTDLKVLIEIHGHFPEDHFCYSVRVLVISQNSKCYFIRIDVDVALSLGVWQMYWNSLAWFWSTVLYLDYTWQMFELQN